MSALECQFIDMTLVVMNCTYSIKLSAANKDTVEAVQYSFTSISYFLSFKNSIKSIYKKIQLKGNILRKQK